MNKLISGLSAVPDSVTMNYAPTYSSSNSAVLDLFFSIGAARNVDSLQREFIAALREDARKAMRVLLWSRDCRGGAGERKHFVDLLSLLTDEVIIDMLPFIPEYGRWKDVIDLYKTTSSEKVEAACVNLIVATLKAEDAPGRSLLAKWLPRKGPVAHELAYAMNLRISQYRKLIVSLSNTVEQKMCANEWGAIAYEHVPSVASARYMRAFHRHDHERYQAYIDSVSEGKAKINTSVVFPHDVMRVLSAEGCDAIQSAEVMWKSMADIDVEGILPLSDVSDSMDTYISGSLTAMDVSIAMGMYISEKQKGVWKDKVMTFETNPKFVELKGSLWDRRYQLSTSRWGCSTNIGRAFELILNVAVENNVPQEDMPKYLLILSDMEFDTADYTGSTRMRSIFQSTKELYAAKGYVLPQIIFWNLDKKTRNFPVRNNEYGAVLVSGFSTSILKNINKLEKFTPEHMLLETIMVPRYDIPNVT